MVDQFLVNSVTTYLYINLPETVGRYFPSYDHTRGPITPKFCIKTPILYAS
jgi:hypothetical protein